MSLMQAAVSRHMQTLLSRGQELPDPSYDERLVAAIDAAMFRAGDIEELLQNNDIENIDCNGCDEIWITYADERGKVRGRHQPGARPVPHRSARRHPIPRHGPDAIGGGGRAGRRYRRLCRPHLPTPAGQYVRRPIPVTHPPGEPPAVAKNVPVAPGSNRDRTRPSRRPRYARPAAFFVMPRPGMHRPRFAGL